MMSHQRVRAESLLQPNLDESDPSDEEDIGSEDSSEDENYVPEPIDESDSEISEGDLEDDELNYGQVGQILAGKDGTQWSTDPPNLVGVRAIPANIVREQRGLSREARNIQHISDAFKLCITDEMLDIVLRHSNRKGVAYYVEKNRERQQQGLEPQTYSPITMVELKAFIGLLLIAGATKSATVHTVELWAMISAPIYRATMRRNRFHELHRFIRFDNKATRNQRQETDKFAAIREIWDMLQARLGAVYKPGPFMCVDEELVATRGRVGFRQYIPTKPGKYGIKVFWNTDAETAYPLKASVYLGRQEGENRARNVGATVVKNLTRPWWNKGRNVTTDNFFTDVNLAKDLLAQGTTLVGTLRKNKREIPNQMLPSRQRPVDSSIFGFDQNLTLVSYVPKRSKAVILLSSMHHDNAVDHDNHDKPHIIQLYNETKSGVDTLDHLIRLYSCNRTTRRWPHTMFMNMLDTAGVAAFIVYIQRFPDWNATKMEKRRLFLTELGYSLVQGQIATRVANPRACQKGALIALKALGHIVYAPAAQAPPPVARNRDRCHICPRNVGCEKFVCSQHSTVTCTECDQNEVQNDQ